MSDRLAELPAYPFVENHLLPPRQRDWSNTRWFLVCLGIVATFWLIDYLMCGGLLLFLALFGSVFIAPVYAVFGLVLLPFVYDAAHRIEWERR